MDILVIGSFVMDTVAKVDNFPKDGQTIIGKSLNFYPGGKGANQCVAAKRCGANVEMSGMLGNDENGKAFLELFHKEEISTDSVFVTDIAPTAVGLVQINDKSENKIVVIPGANHIFDKAQLGLVKEKIKRAKLVLLQLELQQHITEEIILLCDEFKVPVLLNPAPACKLKAEILSKVTYLTPNETELEILSGCPVDNEFNIKLAAKKLLATGVRTVVVTLGKRGALIADQKGIRIVEGFTVTAVDTVAAGDCFNGALSSCIVNGSNIDYAVRFANAAGALSVTKQGAIPSLPYLEDIKKFLNSKD